MGALMALEAPMEAVALVVATAVTELVATTVTMLVVAWAALSEAKMVVATD